MSDFNFEDFISGVTVDLPREQVPIFTVVHQARIDELDAQIEAMSESEGGADDREATAGATGPVRERDALVAEQEQSARYVTLRCLSAQEFVDVVQNDECDIFDQIAAQTRGTENEMARGDVERIREVALPSAWALFISHANRVVQQQLVMPDFSPTSSAKRGAPTS